VVSVQFLWCVQYSIHCRKEPFEPSMIFFLTFENFFDVDDDDDDACNLNKMMINSLLIVCTNVSHFC